MVRLLHGRRVLGFAMSVVMVAGISTSALGYHDFSVGRENNLSWGYTGVKGSRTLYDLTISSCGVPVFQSMWLNLSSPGLPVAFVELGTAYDCARECGGASPCWFDYEYFAMMGRAASSTKHTRQALEITSTRSTTKTTRIDGTFTSTATNPQGGLDILPTTRAGGYRSA
jgi:hypothetical protein